MFKKVSDYTVDLRPYSYGDHSEILLAKKNTDATFKYIGKCIQNIEIIKIRNFITNEVENAELYKTTNCIIKYKETFRTKNNFYLIYDFFDSYTLSQLISNPAPIFITFADKLNLALNIAKTIKRLHDAKLMHRNLNPSHILVSKDLKSILFCGVKSLYNFAHGYPSQTIGSKPYMAPEIFLTEIMVEPYDEKVDIYSFGVILFQLFVGIPKLIELPQELDKFYDEMPKCIKQLIQGCLNMDPQQRISSSKLIDDEYYKFEEVKLPKYNPPPRPKTPIFDLQIFNINTKDSLKPYINTGEKCGEGAYGTVLKVKNEENNSYYAIKKIRLGKLKTPHERELVFGEVNLLYTLRDISFVISLIDAFKLKNSLYMVLELCNGGDLEKKVKTLYTFNLRLNIEDVKLIAWNLAEGLLEMHKRKIVHRDLKPANILLVTDSKNRIIDAKISDLGIGRKLKEHNPEFETIAGTRSYWAPEFWSKQFDPSVKLTNKVDVFSYGLILFFMIYGNDAIDFADDKKSKSHKNFAKGILTFPQDKISSPQPEILDLMQKCLDPNPETRISFEQIIIHPFFSKVKIPILPEKYLFNEMKSKYEGTTNLGLIDSSKNYWVKLYKEATLSNKNYLKQIEREISFLNISRLVPHIVEIVDFGMYKGKIALIFKYCNGGNLYQLFIKRSSVLNLDPSTIFGIDETKLVAKCLIQFIDGMQGRNYVHRGINPSHILLELDSFQKIKDAKVCGFRSSKSENESPEVTFVNDPYYKYFDPTSIEEGYSEESDLWSIGLVIYFMSTGKDPVANLKESKEIRAKGQISLPANIDPHVKKFIEFCIRNRKRGSMYNKVLLEEIAKEGIII